MRIATFNVENLFSRFKFARGVDPAAAIEFGFTTDDLRFRLEEPEAKRITALAIDALQADVLCLQEVEGLDTLKRFRDQHLGGRVRYPHVAMIDGNDRRRIDVAVMSAFPIPHIRSWQHVWDDGAPEPVFSRDCLEVDVDCPGLGVVTLYVNHLKSMRADGVEGNGRPITRPIRVRQCRAVREIVEHRFGVDPHDAPFVVLGDMNDYPEADAQGTSGILDLTDWPVVENVVERLPAEERWTHFWKGVGHLNIPPAYHQLDYLLPSRGLAARNPGMPHLERRGQPRRAERCGPDRFDGVGWDRPKASDHCPLAFDIHRL